MNFRYKFYSALATAMLLATAAAAQEKAPVVDVKLPADKVQYILNVLAQRPYSESAELIAEVSKQAQAQLAAKEQKK